ncbi:MAG: type II toxin-antitoxin system death-on-curing family toxin [Phycisphaeraceae bacterium]|nr:type II toxin-antitoxin system death-on-curing family toxin [Phycisphaeraceae bacterium]
MNAPLKIGQPRFLTKDEVLSLHRASIDLYGGAEGVLDDGALESALAQPRQAPGGEFAHEFPFGMAAAYGYHLAMNHAFRDGNKRTSFAAMVAFLRMNGWNFELPDGHAADMMLEMIAEHRDKVWLTEKLVAASRARPSLELRDFFYLLRTDLVDELMQIRQGHRPSELAESVRQAHDAMPILDDYLTHASMAKLVGNEADATYWDGQRALLVALVRRAAALGYDW